MRVPLLVLIIALGFIGCLGGCLGARSPADPIQVTSAPADTGAGSGEHPDVHRDTAVEATVPAPHRGVCAAACRTDDACGAGQVCDTPENANANMDYRWHCVTATAENGVGFPPRYTDAQARTFDGVCKADTDCSVLTACTLGREARICRSLCTVDSDCRYMTHVSTSDGVCVAGRCETCDPGRAETCDPSTVCRLAPPPDYGHCAPVCGSDADCRGTGLFCVGTD